MAVSDARRLARIGEFYLQEAIMDVLYEAPEGLLLGMIRSRLGLSDQGYSATVTGQLKLLRGQNKVYQPRGKGTPWMLTKAERERRNAE